MQDHQGIPKGLKAVLMERGLWPKEGILLDCRDDCPEGSVSCCARKIIASQPDFKAQKSSIEEVIVKSGHLVEFYPKFHCECNFIERFWGEGKRIARGECEYTFASLQVKVPTILETIPLEHIRAYHRKSWRYIHAYSIGLDGTLADWAVKKYKSHRRIGGRVEELIEEFEKKKKLHFEK